MVPKLIQLDGKLAPRTREIAVMRFRTGIAALLSASKQPEALKYLRELFEREPDRRQILAMGLAAEPEGENWPLLVRGMAVAEGEPARFILGQLAQVPRKPDAPEPLRQAILCGLRLGDQGGKLAVALMAHWTGASVSTADEPWNTALAKWQDWFRQKYPNELDPSPPIVGDGSSWTHEDLIGLLIGADVKPGDPERGAVIFEKATCIKCHRYGSRGESIGPDLTTISQRFHKKEIVESVLFPSQVISDQYAAKTVQTKDGLTYTGIVAEQGGTTIVVLDNQAKKNVIAKEDIAEMAPAKQSAMPEGLFNTLTREEIVDLFAYMASPPQ
jgi:putative heme-binding domain-containing protein